MNNNEKTLSRYDEIVNSYFELNKENEKVESQLSTFCSILNGKEILDVGSGFGRDTNSFTSKGFNCLGIDASKQMLAKAHELYPTCSFSYFNLLKDDYSSLSKYDGIWSCASLLHFNPHQMKAVLCRLLKLLNEDGVLCISLKIDEEMYSYTDEGRWFQLYTKEYLDNLYHDLGLTILSYEESECKKGSIRFATHILKV